MDLLSRSLVMTDGAPAFGADTVSAQWFDKDGTALTGEYKARFDWRKTASSRPGPPFGILAKALGMSAAQRKSPRRKQRRRK